MPDKDTSSSDMPQSQCSDCFWRNERSEYPCPIFHDLELPAEGECVHVLASETAIARGAHAGL